MHTFDPARKLYVMSSSKFLFCASRFALFTIQYYHITVYCACLRLLVVWKVTVTLAQCKSFCFFRILSASWMACLLFMLSRASAKTKYIVRYSFSFEVLEVSLERRSKQYHKQAEAGVHSRRHGVKPCWIVGLTCFQEPGPCKKRSATVTIVQVSVV